MVTQIRLSSCRFLWISIWMPSVREFGRIEKACLKWRGTLRQSAECMSLITGSCQRSVCRFHSLPHMPLLETNLPILDSNTWQKIPVAAAFFASLLDGSKLHWQIYSKEVEICPAATSPHHPLCCQQLGVWFSFSVSIVEQGPCFPNQSFCLHKTHSKKDTWSSQRKKFWKLDVLMLCVEWVKME